MNQEQLIWKYLDGQCSAEEKAAIEQQLSSDENFRALLEERKSLDQAFEQLELEQPSLRFATNVMENLPALYQQLPVRQLLGPSWIKAFWGSLTALLVAAIAAAFYLPDSSTANNPAYSRVIGDTLERIPDVLLLPYKWAMILVAISCSFLLLMMLDRRMAARSSKKLSS